MSVPSRVLVVGDMRPGTNSRSLADGFIDAAQEVRVVDSSFIFTDSLFRRIAVSKLRRVDPAADRRLRREVREATGDFEPTLLVCIKTIYFDQSIFLDVPASVRLHYSFDDVSNDDNVSSRYLKSESAWHGVVTTKRHNVPEIRARGGNPIFQWAAYDPGIHRRTVGWDQRRYSVGFIGAMRPDRQTLPALMASRLPGQAVIAGPRWDRAYPEGVNGVDLLPAQMGDAYTSLANDVRAGLVLLNSENRDQHTNRSIETPAMGQLVLAQRTPEHEDLFTHGETALLFDTFDEAIWQVKSTTKEPARAKTIAEAGFRRISSGGFTYQDRAAHLLNEVRA